MGAETELLPGIVFIDGSGPGDVEDWGGWPEWVSRCGAVVLRHAKPGTGAPGDWRQQTISDRADDTLAAVELLRSWSGVDSSRVGVMGFSQGGWVAPVAATRVPETITFLINVSGPGVGVRETERYRLHRAATDGGFDAEAVLRFFQEAVAALSSGDVGKAVELAGAAAGEAWYPILEGLYETPETAGFLAGILDFDPTPFMKALACPFLVCFGTADALVPVDESVAALAPLLNRHTSSGLLVFPGADHGIFIADPDPEVERSSQLAPGFLSAMEGFLSRL